MMVSRIGRAHPSSSRASALKDEGASLVPQNSTPESWRRGRPFPVTPHEARHLQSPQCAAPGSFLSGSTAKGARTKVGRPFAMLLLHPLYPRRELHAVSLPRHPATGGQGPCAKRGAGYQHAHLRSAPGTSHDDGSSSPGGRLLAPRKIKDLSWRTPGLPAYDCPAGAVSSWAACLVWWGHS